MVARHIMSLIKLGQIQQKEAVYWKVLATQCSICEHNAKLADLTMLHTLHQHGNWFSHSVRLFRRIPLRSTVLRNALCSPCLVSDFTTSFQILKLSNFEVAGKKWFVSEPSNN